MFPTIRQRVAILIAVLAAGLLYLKGAAVAVSANAIPCVTLLAASDPLATIAFFAVITAVALVLGTLVGAIGNPLAGVFVLGASLAFPAVKGGGIDKWLRQAESSNAYWALVGEVMIWAVMIGVAMVAMDVLIKKIQRAMPWLIADREIVDDSNDEQSDSTNVLDQEVEKIARVIHLTPTGVRGLFSMVVAVVAGVFLTGLLIRTPDMWQVVWGLWLAFLIVGLVAHQLFPSGNVLGVLLSPFVVAVIWYVWAAIGNVSSHGLLQAYFDGTWPAGAMALPIYYASAGVAGAVSGVGWSVGLIRSNEIEQQLLAQADSEAA